MAHVWTRNETCLLGERHLQLKEKKRYSQEDRKKDNEHTFPITLKKNKRMYNKERFDKFQSKKIDEA